MTSLTSYSSYSKTQWLKEKKGKHFIVARDFMGQELGRGSAGYIFCSIWHQLKSFSGIRWAEGLVRRTRWLHSHGWYPVGMAGRLGTASLKRHHVTFPAQWSQGSQTLSVMAQSSQRVQRARKHKPLNSQ